MKEYTMEEIRSLISSTIDEGHPKLWEINKQIHKHPETAYQEYRAHDTITSFLESRGFAVKRHTYGLETSFEAEIGAGGPLVIICAEYDALPQIGHACGHNLIATSSIATFIAAAEAVKMRGLAGRVRILGTPAEEGGGGKAKLIDAGAFADPDIAAAIMAHPLSNFQFSDPNGCSGLAGMKLIASHKFRTEFRGTPAHAAADPWNGVNALDAAVSAYNNVGLLRQQIAPDERIHAVIEVGGTVPNVITDYTRMNWNVRSPALSRCDKLLERVKACIASAATATGCKLDYIMAPTYSNLRENKTLCRTYVEEMSAFGEKVMLEQEGPLTASTDMGNVSHKVPSFHGGFAIPCSGKDVAPHKVEFAAAAGTEEAHKAALKAAKGMAMLAIRVLLDEDVAEGARVDFEKPDE